MAPQWDPVAMPDDAGTLEQLNSEIAAAHERLSDALSSADAKTVLVVGYALAAATFLATQHPEKILGALAYLAFGLAVVSAIFAYAIRNYREVEPRVLFNDYFDKDKAELLRALAATRVQHYEHNKDLLNTKVAHWWRSLALLLTGTVLMISGILVHTGSHDVKRAAGRVAAHHVVSREVTGGGPAGSA
jgi:hypothetical protein